jgi:ligand-binding SRPBCC domain-containing protein
MKTRVGPFMARWEAEHTDYEVGRMFRDRQVKGPFAKWVHTHRFEPDGQGGSWLIDQVDYELPLGALGRLFGGGFVRQKLERMFAYRHQVTKEACERRA